MVWIFVSVVLIAVVYLTIQFPAFRKAISICLGLIVVAVAAGAGLLYYNQIQDEKLAELSRRLIRPDEIEITDVVLGHEILDYWKVQGQVTNRSVHELTGFTLKITVRDCPVSGKGCTVIGEDDGSTPSYSFSVPSKQMRAFEVSVNLRNLPKPVKWEKWDWNYVIQEVRGKVK